MLRGFSFAGIGWITALHVHPASREVMTDRRPLLRAIFDAAVAAAHPDVVLRAHLRPAPKGRVICLAAGKAAAALAAAAERYYLDEVGLEPSLLPGDGPARLRALAPAGAGGGVLLSRGSGPRPAPSSGGPTPPPRPWRTDTADQGDRS